MSQFELSELLASRDSSRTARESSLIQRQPWPIKTVSQQTGHRRFGPQTGQEQLRWQTGTKEDGWVDGTGRTGSRSIAPKRVIGIGCPNPLMCQPTADTNPLVRPASLSWRRLSGLIQPYLSNERAGQNQTLKASVNVLLVVPMGQLVAPSEHHAQSRQRKTREISGPDST